MANKTETKATRAAYKNVNEAFKPIAAALNLNYTGDTPDFTKAGTVYLDCVKGGFYRPMQVTEDGGNRPVLQGLAPLKASDAVLVFNGIAAALHQLKAAQVK